MRLTLPIAAVAAHVPRPVAHTNLLGPVLPGAFYHLLDKAGEQSRPRSVPRKVMVIDGEEYFAPTADEAERSTDLVSRAVDRLVAAAPTAVAHVRAILHAQCTIDQQILASSSLRVAHDHFPPCRYAFAIDQMGTAGLAAALRLAAMAVADGGLACVSASDKWMAPLVRRVPGLVTYADAAAACFVGSPEAIVDPVATIEALAVSCRPPPFDPWTAPPEQQLAYLLDEVGACVAEVVRDGAPAAHEEIDLYGDGFCGLNQRLAAATSLRPQALPDGGEIHHSSASALVCLGAAIGAAAGRGTPQRSVIWTASPTGHAAAILVRASERAIATAGAWATAASWPHPDSPEQGRGLT